MLIIDASKNDDHHDDEGKKTFIYKKRSQKLKKLIKNQQINIFCTDDLNLYLQWLVKNYKMKRKKKVTSKQLNQNKIK